MTKPILLAAILLAVLAKADAQVQNAVSTKTLAAELNRLIEHNTGKNAVKYVVDLSGKEYVAISLNATRAQVITITAPYLQTKDLVARDICLSLLSEALMKKTGNAAQQQQLVELICKNYLNNEEIHRAGAILLRLTAKDFDARAKKYIAALANTIKTYQEYDRCALLLGLAQIKTSIPVLWQLVNKDIAAMGQPDVNVLAALARMDEKEAGALLCRYYNSKKTTDYKQIFVAGQLAFSMDKTVLDCMVSDYKTIDVNAQFRDGDTGYWPSVYLGQCINGMLKNYPHHDDAQLAPQQLLDWLNGSAHYELAEK